MIRIAILLVFLELYFLELSMSGKPLQAGPGISRSCPVCCPGGDSISPVAAAAAFFCIRFSIKEPDAPGRVLAKTKNP
jgi:hypothetical protein